MRFLLAAVLLLLPALGMAQSRDVLPRELELTVTVEEADHRPFVREMVLLTIRGVYRRHITLEKLKNPDFEGFSWTQLGPDSWREERIGGERVKTMTRRMAVYPDRAGELTIGSFTHELTLTDENDDWFEYEILSKPVTLTIEPVPQESGWWFPVRDLKISDQWSNAPDQLKPGEGVLRVIRLEALGVTPEMIPPMPELTSPSAMIFAHPDKRLVDLTSEGPITYVFWRWTIRPGNDTSGIVEPLSLEFFNTTTRTPQTVTISAQRVAYGARLAAPEVAPETVPPQAALPSWPLAALGLAVFAGGLALSLSGRRVAGLGALQRFALFDPLQRALRRAARQGDVAAMRRAAAALIARDGPAGHRAAALASLDAAVFGKSADRLSIRGFARDFLQKPSG